MTLISYISKKEKSRKPKVKRLLLLLAGLLRDKQQYRAKSNDPNLKAKVKKRKMWQKSQIYRTRA